MSTYYTAYCFDRYGRDAKVICIREGFKTYDDAFDAVEDAMWNRGARYAEIVEFRQTGWYVEESVQSCISYDPKNDFEIHDPLA